MRTAFVLSGGASLGAVHAGMLHALYEREVYPDVLIGTSAGAVNAAFAASRPCAMPAALELERIWTGLARGDVFPASPLTAVLALAGVRDHAVPSSALRRTIRRHLKLERLEDAPVPLHVVAADARSGDEVLLSSGPAVEAILASAAIPGVFPPVRWGSRLLVDGAIVNNTPISHAVALGADRVIVLPAFAAGRMAGRPRGALGAGTAALARVLGRRLEDDLVRYAQDAEIVVLPPPALEILPTDFAHARELIDEALRAARVRLRRGVAPAAPARAA